MFARGVTQRDGITIDPLFAQSSFFGPLIIDLFFPPASWHHECRHSSLCQLSSQRYPCFYRQEKAGLQ